MAALVYGAAFSDWGSFGDRSAEHPNGSLEQSGKVVVSDNLEVRVDSGARAQWRAVTTRFLSRPAFSLLRNKRYYDQSDLLHA